LENENETGMTVRTTILWWQIELICF